MFLTKYAQLLRYLDDNAEGQDGGQPPASDEGVTTPPATPDGTKDTDTTDEQAGGDGASDKSKDESGSEAGNSDYQDFELPEGMVMDESAAEAFMPLMKEAGLSQEQAQSMVTAYATLKQAEAEQAMDSASQQVSEWYETAASDKEIGGDNWEQSQKLAVSAVDKFGSPELKSYLKETGLGNHPELIRLMVNVGKAIQEDNPGGAGSLGAEKKDRVSVLYPNS